MAHSTPYRRLNAQSSVAQIPAFHFPVRWLRTDFHVLRYSVGAVMFFRELTEEETAEFQRYAREHDPEPEKWSIYHPVCREEWRRLGKGPILG